MSAPERTRLEGLADDVKERALELRGTPDPDGAGRDLEQASERLADAMAESADADPEVPDAEVEPSSAATWHASWNGWPPGEVCSLRTTKPSRPAIPSPGITTDSHSPAPHAAATLEFRGATKLYPGQDSPAVDKLSLEVARRRRSACSAAPSGCGKTTAMRMVNRMIDITDGDILLDGVERQGRASPPSCGARSATRSSRSACSRTSSIADNIGTVPRAARLGKKQIAARVDELLELVSLDPARHARPLPRAALGRPAPARRRGPCPGGRPAADAHGRAVRRIDPINRERLQNEFLRLQKEIQKTIVFVTHDIDEAIKMGDKIAVLQRGGKLAQFAAPAELLMYPESKFVEDFVGADRALKRLALQRVRDIDLWKVATVRLGEPVSEVQSKLADADVKSHVLVVDDQNRPQGWVSKGSLTGDRVDDARMTSTGRSRWTTSCATPWRTSSRARRATAPWSTTGGRSRECCRSR